MFERPSLQQPPSEYERTLQALIQASSDVCFRVSADWSNLLHLTGNEFIADNTTRNPDWLERYIPLEDHKAVQAEIERATRTKTTYLIEHRVNRLDGNVGWAVSRAVPLFDKAGNITEWLGTASDITEHKRAITALQEGETRLRLAVDAGQIGEWELDLSTNTSIRALRHDQIFGYDAPIKNWGLDTFLGHVLPEDRTTVETEFQEAAQTGAGWNFQCRIRRNGDDALRWIAAYSASQIDDENRTTKLFGMVQDITDYKTAEIGLRELNQSLEQLVIERTAKLRLYGNLIQSSVSPICAFDSEYRLIASNQALNDEFFRVYGYHAQLGKVYPDQFPADQASIMRGYMARALAGEAYSVIEKFGDPAIIKPYWEIHYAPLRDQDEKIIGAFLFANDISDRLRIEAELDTVQEALRQSQKMEAVGQLTGGLAHDFNNLLAGISGSLELMQTRMQQGRFNDMERYMAAAQTATRRAAALTHRLLAFSRRQTLDPKPTDVMRLAMGMQEMIQRTVGPGILIDVVGAASSWPALVDPSQLENAILNLCINSRDAMPEGGSITIETANKWIDERAARQHDMPEGQYLALSVTDTGMGMPPEIVGRVFEPFFTTKPIGQGTGLGLSMIYGFAHQSGGQVRIYTEVGQGTTVSIYLPRHYGGLVADEAIEKTSELSRSENGETVLIVDDEPTMRMLIVDILDDLGYASIEASDSATGLKILQSNARIDLLVTDVGLPGGMNGRQMVDAARITRPSLKVLFITGYAENAFLGNGNFTPGMALLTKPFSMDAMATRIRSMIEDSKKHL